MAVSGRLLPQRVDMRFTAVFDYLGEAHRFDLEKFHCESPDRPGSSDAVYQRDAQLENAAPGRCHGILVSVKDQRIDSASRFCLHRAREMARFSLACFCFRAATSCTTLVNRRDLYSPEPAPDSLEAARQWYGVTTIRTTTTIRTQRAAGEIAAPDFRY